MPAVESLSQARPKTAEVVPHGYLSHVWLRKDVVQDTADTGPGGSPATFWKCTELHFVTDGPITERYAEEHMDELWEAHERDGLTVEERLAEAEQANRDNAAAILELGDLVAGE